MRWSWQIARVAGIPVRIHATFLLLPVFYVWWSLGQGESLARASEGLLLLLSVFACVVLHEFGHALTARRFGVRTRDITLLPIGGVARLERIPEKPSQEIAVALAGPAVNVVIAGIVLAVLMGSAALEGQSLTRASLESVPVQFLGYNVFLAVFNLIPAFPMDGGRVLRALIATRLDYVRATQIAASIGQGIAFVFGFLGLVGHSPLLVLVALFVFVGAGQEAAAVQLRSTFDGVPVSQAMLRDFRTLRGDEPLSRAVELLLSGSQQDFPVLSAGPGVAILSRKDLIAALAAGDTARRVDEVARETCGTAHPREMLQGVFQRMQEIGCQAIPVVEGDGTLVGLLTLENVGELAMVRAALRRSLAR